MESPVIIQKKYDIIQFEDVSPSPSPAIQKKIISSKDYITFRYQEPERKILDSDYKPVLK